MSRALWLALLSTVAPVVAYVIAADSLARENCVECPLLFTVGAAYLFGVLLVLNMSYLLTLIPAGNGWRIFLVVVAALFPAAAYAYITITSYTNADGVLDKSIDYLSKVPVMITLGVCNVVSCLLLLRRQ